MAKVKTEKTYYDVGTDRREFIKEYKLDTKSGAFSIALPYEVTVAIGRERVTGDTLQEVDEAYSEAMAEYKSSEIETVKVILYHFDYHSRDREPANTTHYNSGIMISIRAGVYNEHKGTAKSGKVTYKYEKIESLLRYWPLESWDHTKPYSGRIEWTQDLEDFFVNTQEALEKIIEKLEEISSPPALVQFAYNRLLLGGPGIHKGMVRTDLDREDARAREGDNE